MRDRQMWAASATLIAIIALAYRPGLGGTFWFDDYPSLMQLSAVAGERTAYSVLQYILNGVSSTLGRPLSLLTFAAQASSWSDRPADFIGVNILLHLANGGLWLAFLLQLQRLSAIPRARWLPLLACALWLVMPIHASAVLYVVQRMTVLATTFTLLGLVLYVSGRLAARDGRIAAGYVSMSAGVAVATVLGTLAKENAAVSPWLLLLLEATLLRDVPRPPRFRAWSVAFLWAPALLLLGYLAVSMPAFVHGYATRPFTLGQRLLTEPRVLAGYLTDAFVPHTWARVLYDDLTVSTDPFQPPTTALALALWTAAIVFAVLARQRYRLLSFAVGWYLIGHVIESTFIPLELAFAHRTYLPLLGVCLGITGQLAIHAERSSERVRLAYAAGATVYLGLLAICLWMSASLWGQPLNQARVWVSRQPESHRAVHQYGQMLTTRGQVGAALALYEGARRHWPDDAVIAVSRLQLRCFDPHIEAPVADVQAALRAYHGSDAARAAGVVDDIVEHIGSGECRSLAPDDVLALLDTMLASPRFAHVSLMLNHSAAMLLDHVGRKAEALDRLDRTIAQAAQVPLLQQAALWSVQLGDSARARGYLATLESSGRISPRQRWIYRDEIRGTRQLIELYDSLPGERPR